MTENGRTTVHKAGTAINFIAMRTPFQSVTIRNICFVLLSVLVLWTEGPIQAVESLPSEMFPAMEKVKQAAADRNMEVLIAAMRHPHSAVRSTCAREMQKQRITPVEQIPVWREALLSDQVWERQVGWDTNGGARMDMREMLGYIFGQLLERKVEFKREFTLEERRALVALLDVLAGKPGGPKPLLPESIPGTSAVPPTPPEPTPSSATPLPGGSPAAQAPSTTPDYGAPAWQWIAGLATFLVMVVLALKLRS